MWLIFFPLALFCRRLPAFPIRYSGWFFPDQTGCFRLARYRALIFRRFIRGYLRLF